MKQKIMAVAAVAAVWCGSSSAWGVEPTIEDNWANHYAEASNFFGQWRGDRSNSCAADSLIKAASAVDAMRIDGQSLLYVASQMDYESVRSMYVQKAAKLAPTTLSMHFEVADAALERNCLDTAEHLYREVVRTYTGSAWSGYRDRARLGIEDVRDRRAQASPKKE